jgi:ATP-dependent DNA helicase RecG
MSLNKSVSYINGFGLNRTKVLEKELKIYTLNDLLYFFPRRYVDRSKFYTPSEIDSTSAEIQIIGIIKDLKIISGNKGNRLIAKLCDEKSCVELVWFKGIKWVESKININQKYLAFGRVNKFGNNLSVPHPEIEIYNYEKLKHKKGNFQPIYPSTEKVIKAGLTQKKIRESVYNLLKDYKKEINEVFSNDILKKYKLVDKKKALFDIHFPKNQKDLNNAEYRLKFEELFFLQLQLALKKNKRKIDLRKILAF